MWTNPWSLAEDPFLGPGAPYVRTRGHEEAIARLANAIESGERFRLLQGVEGSGKSTVLNQTIARLRTPFRRFARVCAPIDGPAMLAGLASGLGRQIPRASDRPFAWKALADALQLCRWQKLHAILIVDGAETLMDSLDRRDLERLTRLDLGPKARLTVLTSLPDSFENFGDDWSVPIGIPAMIRSETIRYVTEKLALASSTASIFPPDALARLHDLSGGLPRSVDRLGSHALRACALRGMDRVTPEILDAIDHDCRPIRDGFAA